MNIYLNKNKMITTMTKRKTIAPTAPITASTLGSAISDFNSTKKKIVLHLKIQINLKSQTKGGRFWLPGLKIQNVYIT